MPLNSIAVARTQVLFTNLCVALLNMPPPFNNNRINENISGIKVHPRAFYVDEIV